MTARIIDCTPDAYHKRPGLSSSLAKILIARCPAVARDIYQRQVEQAAEEIEDEDAEATAEADDVKADKQKRLDRGNILHALTLGIGKRIVEIPKSVLSKNGAYGTAESKAMRDAARAAGCIPVKEPELRIYEQMAAAIRVKLEHAGRVFDGTSELAIEWDEDVRGVGVLCRAMLDHVRLFGPSGGPVRIGDGSAPAFATIYDLKFPCDASPDSCERRSEGLGYPIQSVVYPRALNALYPSLQGRIEFRFLFIEPRRPYPLWDPVPSGMFREVGDSQWRRALLAWADGQATGEWPDYRSPNRAEIDAPMWLLRKEGFSDAE